MTFRTKNLIIIGSADPRLLGALRKTVSLVGVGGDVGMKAVPFLGIGELGGRLGCPQLKGANESSYWHYIVTGL